MKFFSQPEWDADVPEESTHENLTQKSKLKKRSKELASSISSDIPFVKISKSNKPHKEDRQQESNAEKASAIDIEKSSVKRKNEEHEIKPTKKHKPSEATTKIDSVVAYTGNSKDSGPRAKQKKKATKRENKVSKPKHKPVLVFSNIQLDTGEVSNCLLPDSNKKNVKSNVETCADMSVKPAVLVNKEPSIGKNAMKKLKKVKNTSKPIGESVTPVKNIVKSNANAPISAKTLKNRKRRSKKNKTLNIIPSDSAPNAQRPKMKEVISENTDNVVLNSKKSNSFANKIRNLLNTEIANVDTKDKTENVPEVKLSTKNDKKTRLLKPLRQRMVERLKGARFRYLNEQMYVKESNDAQQLFKEDPQAFQAYHDGYRQQVNKWPLNPLDTIIKDISQMPKEYVIADLGCGDGRLGKSVPNKVHSFDLVSLDPSVKACDMSHTPLLTAEVNVVVFCLSLMGTNLKEYILEANRVLKVGGLLKVAEVESRFESVETFLKDVEKYGFSLIKSDLNHNLFYFMDFKKERDIKKRNKLPQLSLKPCYYKKR